MIYGTEGTRALFTGLATQIVYGGCDHDTVDFYSKASGTTTADANPDPQKANFRQRPLLTVDEVVTPQVGNAPSSPATSNRLRYPGHLDCPANALV